MDHKALLLNGESAVDTGDDKNRNHHGNQHLYQAQPFLSFSPDSQWTSP